MNPRLAWILLLVFAVGSSACKRSRQLGPPKAVPVSTDATLDLRLMSFNVRYETSDDPGDKNWRQRVIGVVRMIREEQPDVIGVQEAQHGQVADLWVSLPDYDFFGAARDDGQRTGEYAGLFYRRDRFEADATDQGTFWLSDHPEKPGSATWGNTFPRTATWMRLTDRATQRSFYVFNTHWDHRHQGSREKSASLLAARIKSRHHAAEPVVLLGDFNGVEKNPALEQLRREADLIDSFQLMHPRETARTTLHFWRGKRDGTLKVDHILVSKGAEIRSAEIRDHDQPMVSDHFPVTARVRFSRGFLDGSGNAED